VFPFLLPSITSNTTQSIQLLLLVSALTLSAFLLAVASYDILRQYDLTQPDPGSKSTAATPFLIVPGHRTGVISQLYLDPTCTFMISTGGNRGWEGASTEVLLGYEIGIGS